jgi:hypothetical protein
MIEYVILYVIVSLLFRGSVVQISRGSKFSRVPLAQCRVNVGQFESVSSRDTGGDGSY